MDYSAKRKWFFLLSAVVIVPGLIFLIIAPGLKPGIDFTGGSTLTLEFADEVDQEDLRAELSALGHPDVVLQRQTDDTFFLRTKELDEAAKDVVVDGLETALSPSGVTLLSFDLVSPVLARQIVVNSFWAIFAAAIVIFFYIWWAFRSLPRPFRYGTAAIVALLHDTVLVIGIFSILGVVADTEVNKMFLIGILLVIGYSVNDTIVVFDRLRENIVLYPGRTLTAITNLSISETLGRSLNTSLTLLFTLLALMLFGGPTIRPFLLVLLIGVVAGTYSSIAVATQVLVAWESGDFGRLFRRLSPLRLGRSA